MCHMMLNVVYVMLVIILMTCTLIICKHHLLGEWTSGQSPTLNNQWNNDVHINSRGYSPCLPHFFFKECSKMPSKVIILNQTWIISNLSLVFLTYTRFLNELSNLSLVLLTQCTRFLRKELSIMHEENQDIASKVIILNHAISYTSVYLLHFLVFHLQYGGDLEYLKFIFSVSNSMYKIP